MPKLEYFLVCESAVIDRDSNRISLFNVIDAVEITKQESSSDEKVGFPRIPLIQLVASSCWNCDPEDVGQDFQATLRLHIPGRPEPLDFKLNFTAEQKRHRLNFRLQGMPSIEEQGELIFELLLDGGHKATHTVDVNIKEGG